MNIFKSISISGNNRVVVDGKEFNAKSAELKLIIDGKEVEGALTGDIKIDVYGDCKKVECMSGDITVHGEAVSVNTMSGDIECGKVSGGVNTMSGDITIR